LLKLGVIVKRKGGGIMTQKL